MACYVEEAWKCQKHPSKRRRNGICPSCLRDRLSLLCPQCAHTRRSCACLASTSSPTRVADAGDTPSSFKRSISVALPFLRPKNNADQAQSNPKTPSFLSALKKGGSKIRRFDRTVDKNVENSDRNNRIDDFAKMVTRSRSVSVAGKTAAAFRRGDVDSSPSKAKFWRFPSPMKVFRSPKAPKAAAQNPSPLGRCT